MLEIIITRQPENECNTPGNGVITFQGQEIYSFVTLELLWANNKHNISCIPKGIYKGEINPFSDNVPYRHIDLIDIPDREGVKVHAGNFIDFLKIQSRGCILVGSRFVDLDNDGINDITFSQKTLREIVNIIEEKKMNDSFTIKIC